MNYWIFTVKKGQLHNKIHTGEEVYKIRMQDKMWGLGDKTPNRKNLVEGDKVVFYNGTPEKTFLGTAILATSCLEPSQTKQYDFDYGVLLRDIEPLKVPKPMDDELVQKLEFIENKNYWGSYLQGGVRQIKERDFKTIIGEKSLIEQISTTEDLQSQTEFALENQLEEFIYNNWDRILGSKLKLYKTEELNGRQFPAGTWSIDFLAVDQDNKDLVVIELKKGKSSDSAVGQILRYVNWIKEKEAKAGQNVRGIIIAKEVDEALKYSVKNLSYIEVITYKVDFQLKHAQLKE